MIQIFGKSQRYLTPTLFAGTGAQKLFADDPSLKTDPRFDLYPAWLRTQILDGGAGIRVLAGGPAATQGGYKMVMDVMKAGGKIVAGTDSPSAFNLHSELMSYVLAGMTPYQALRAATVNSAEALQIDAGTIEAGKLADIAIVEGNPLENIENAHRVKHVIANGRVYHLQDLLEGKTVSAVAKAQP